MDDPNINGACKIDFSSWGKNDITSREKKALMRLRLLVKDDRGTTNGSPQRLHTRSNHGSEHNSKSRNSKIQMNSVGSRGGVGIITVKGTIANSDECKSE